MPAIHIRVLDQEDAARAVDHHAARAQRPPGAKAPVEMQQRPERRLEKAAQAVDGHKSDFLLMPKRVPDHRGLEGTKAAIAV